MDTKYEFVSDADRPIVYVRAVKVDELPEDMREQAMGSDTIYMGSDTIYAVHSADGERLALVRDRTMAFLLARQNDMTPVTVH